jgi:hypothetical protein
MSAFRKCVFLVDHAEAALVEGRFPKLDETDRLLKVFEEDGVNIPYNKETLRRYVTVGRKFRDPAIMEHMELWEMLEARNALVDSVSMLRAVSSVCTDAAEILFVLKKLFLQQRCEIRKSMKTSYRAGDHRGPKNLIKALLLARPLATLS